nr:YybS family protein [Heyndrickxia shackletonii]
MVKYSQACRFIGNLKGVSREKVKNVRVITEGALLLAVYTVLFLIYLYIPVLFIIATMFLVLPFLLYSAKHPLKYSIVFFIASILISALMGTVLSIPKAIIFGATGIVMGYLVQMNKSKFIIYIASSLTFLLFNILGYIVSVKLFNINYLQQISEQLQESFHRSADILKAIGQGQTDQTLENIQNAISLLTTLFPAMLVIISFMMVWLFIIINFPIAKRFRVNVPKWEPFHKIQLPKSVLWYYLITMLLSLVIHPKTGSYVATALMNLAVIFQIFMLIQGFSLVFYFGHLQKWSKGIYTLIVIFSFFFPPAMFVILILGIIDLGMDIRSKLKGL